jgi:hypothetical protein
MRRLAAVVLACLVSVSLYASGRGPLLWSPRTYGGEDILAVYGAADGAKGKFSINVNPNHVYQYAVMRTTIEGVEGAHLVIRYWEVHKVISAAQVAKEDGWKNLAALHQFMIPLYRTAPVYREGFKLQWVEIRSSGGASWLVALYTLEENPVHVKHTIPVTIPASGDAQ